jgi:hypothetical protein
MHQWKPGSYPSISVEGLPQQSAGLVYRGIGIEPVADTDSGVWYTDWEVTHLASGRLIGSIVGLDEAEALKLATMLADAADWTAIHDLDELARGTLELKSKLLLLSGLFNGSLAVCGVTVAPPHAPAPHWQAH